MSIVVTQYSMAEHTLLLGSQLSESHNQPVLIFINWVNDGDGQDSKSLAALKKQHRLEPLDVTFIDKNSLSKKSPIESLLLTTIEQLNQYQNGSRTRFNLPLDMSHGTDFQQSVWQALQQIPYGQTISYAQLAQNIGKPTAYRAAANANGKNPFSIVVPCHRVVASGGGLGGYTGGIDKKRWLLQLEQRTD